MNKHGSITKSLIIGMAAAVFFCACADEPSDGTVKQSFLFPQFTAAASADRGQEDDSGEISFDLYILKLFRGVKHTTPHHA